VRTAEGIAHWECVENPVPEPEPLTREKATQGPKRPKWVSKHNKQRTKLNLL
jgi:hypothetical protein